VWRALNPLSDWEIQALAKRDGATSSEHKGREGGPLRPAWISLTVRACRRIKSFFKVIGRKKKREDKLSPMKKKGSGFTHPSRVPGSRRGSASPSSEKNLGSRGLERRQERPEGPIKERHSCPHKKTSKGFYSRVRREKARGETYLKPHAQEKGALSLSCHTTGSDRRRTQKKHV